MIDHATDSNTVSKTYTWGLDLSGSLQGAGGVRGLLCVTENPASSTPSRFYPSYDANGNVSEYVNDSDSVIAHYEYSPFGKLTANSGSKADDLNHRFSTKYLDSETALYYYGYRYYSSELGRWLSRDPIQEEGGVNLYGMCHNNCKNLIDAKGEAFISGSIGVGLVAVGIIKAAEKIHEAWYHTKMAEFEEKRRRSPNFDPVEEFINNPGSSPYASGRVFKNMGPAVTATAEAVPLTTYNIQDAFGVARVPVGKYNISNPARTGKAVADGLQGTGYQVVRNKRVGRYIRREWGKADSLPPPQRLTKIYNDIITDSQLQKKLGMTPEQVSALKNAVSNSQKLQSSGTDCND